MPTGIAVIVMSDVSTTAGQPLPEAMVFVTVYVPAVLASKSTTPVTPSITKPAVELNVPGMPPPVNVGLGSVPLLQYGVPE